MTDENSAFLDAVLHGRQHTDEEWESYLEAFHSRFPSANGLFTLMRTYAGFTTYELLANNVAESSPKMVLEVACGDGNLMDFLPDLLPQDARVVAVDVSEEELQVARRRFNSDSRILFLRARARALPFEDTTFDTVVSHQFLNFVPDVAAAIREMVRVLRPGGTLHVATNRGWLDRREHTWVYLYDAALEAATSLHPEMLRNQRMSDKRIYSEEGIREIFSEHPSLRLSTLETQVVYPNARMTPERVADIYNRLYLFGSLPDKEPIRDAVTRKARELCGDADELIVEIPFRLIRIRKGF
jgi:ubiquinone/menaquinone biosynthesis C-methylase UbiE